MLYFCKNDKNCVRNNSDNIKDISTLFKKCIDGYEKNKKHDKKNCSVIEALNPKLLNVLVKSKDNLKLTFRIDNDFTWGERMVMPSLKGLSKKELKKIVSEYHFNDTIYFENHILVFYRRINNNDGLTMSRVGKFSWVDYFSPQG